MQRFSMGPTRKRILIMLCIIFFVALLIRVLLFNSVLLAEVATNYKRTPGAPVVVMIFYEVLCPDSKYFITKQLLPTYKKAASIVDVQLVPFGKAHWTTNEDGSFSFSCQHGATECQGNIIHACAIEAIEDPMVRLEVVACMIRDNRTPTEALRKCGKQHDVQNIDLIQKCFDSSHGEELLKIHGEATLALRPPITFVPTITLDGLQGRQASILKDLFGEVCKLGGDNEQFVQVCNK